MQTLKTLVVLAVLAIVGYGLYVGLNNGFDLPGEPPETPDWIERQISDPTGGGPTPPSIDLGGSVEFPPGTSPVVAPAATHHPPPDSGPSPAASGAAGTQYPGVLANPPATTPPPATATTSDVTPADPSVSPAEAAYGVSPSGTAAPVTTDPLAGPRAQPSATPGAAAPAATAEYAVPPIDSAASAAAVPAGTESPEATSPSPAGPPAAGENRAFLETMTAAREQLNSGQFSTALLALTLWYEDPNLSTADHNELVTLLDQAAGTAIYSRQHLLEPAHVVTAGEKLADIAAGYNVPPGLLAKINGVGVGQPLTAGLELKVVRGPFYGVIDTDQGILTLWVANRYAGRFPTTLGPEFEQIVGTFVVKNKVLAHPAHDDQPAIQLGMGYAGEAPPTPTAHQLFIAGMQNPADASRGEVPGRVGVSTRDAGDLIDILSEGSQITIRR